MNPMKMLQRKATESLSAVLKEILNNLDLQTKLLKEINDKLENKDKECCKTDI